jgi:hypothetical protein
MSVNDNDIQTIVHESAANATEILTHVSGLTPDPVMALASLMLATAVLARSMGMPWEDLLEGATAAFNSVDEDGTLYAH